MTTRPFVPSLCFSAHNRAIKYFTYSVRLPGENSGLATGTIMETKTFYEDQIAVAAQLVKAGYGTKLACQLQFAN